MGGYPYFPTAKNTAEPNDFLGDFPSRVLIYSVVWILKRENRHFPTPLETIVGKTGEERGGGTIFSLDFPTP